MLSFLRKRGAVCPETWGRVGEMFPKSKRLEFPLPSCHQPCVHRNEKPAHRNEE